VSVDIERLNARRKKGWGAVRPAAGESTRIRSKNYKRVKIDWTTLAGAKRVEIADTRFAREGKTARAKVAIATAKCCGRSRNGIAGLFGKMAAAERVATRRRRP